jgi:hypothetical protein
MGTEKVVFVEDPEDLTIAHTQPEVTSPSLTGSGSDRKSRKWSRSHAHIFPAFFSSYYCSSTKCWSTWPQRCSLGCAHAQPDFPLFIGCFQICCVVLHVAFSLCGISKSTFDSLSHPIEGHSAFTQACDWLYI